MEDDRAAVVSDATDVQCLTAADNNRPLSHDSTTPVNVKRVSR